MMSWLGAYLRRRNQQRIRDGRQLRERDSRAWAAAVADKKRTCLAEHGDACEGEHG